MIKFCTKIIWLHTCFFVGRLSISPSISLRFMGLFSSSIDPDLILVFCICLGNCPFHPDAPVRMSIGFCSRIWWFFWISSVSVIISPFSFLILLIWILSLCPLVCLVKGLSILLIFSKNQLLILFILCMVHFVST